MNIDLSLLSQFMKEENKLAKAKYESEKKHVRKDEKEELKKEIYLRTAKMNELKEKWKEK